MEISRLDNATIHLQQNLRLLRKRMNMSQEELASRVGLNRGNIASYENGSAEPKICNLLKLSSLFGVSIIDLTQRDLNNGQALEKAHEDFKQFSSGEAEVLQQHAIRAEELQEVIRSIHTCFHFRVNSLNGQRDSKEFQMVAMKFEELFEAAQELLQNHQSLLDFIRCHCHE